MSNNDPYNRRPLNRGEFDSRCARLEELLPEWSQTSGARSTTRNKAVGGSPISKHLHENHGMAKDYAPDDPATVTENVKVLILRYVATLGMWGKYHDAGTGSHLHCQGLPPGATD